MANKPAPKRPTTSKNDRHEWLGTVVKLAPSIARIIEAVIVHWWR